PDDVRTKVASIDLTRSRGDVLDDLVAELRKLDVDERRIKEIVKRAKRHKVGHRAPPKKSSEASRVSPTKLGAAQVQEVATVAGLTGAAAKALAAAAASTSALNDATLTKLSPATRSPTRRPRPSASRPRCMPPPIRRATSPRRSRAPRFRSSAATRPPP